jgi:hypothetical protein
MIKLTKNFINVNELRCGEYVSNGHWMIHEDFIDFDNFIENPDGSKTLDDFFNSSENLILKLGFKGQKPYIKSMTRDLLDVTQVIPKIEDLVEEWDVIPAIYPFGFVSKNNDICDIKPSNFDRFYIKISFEIEDKFYIVPINYGYYREIVNEGLEIVPNEDPRKPCVIMDRDFENIVGLIMPICFDDIMAQEFLKYKNLKPGQLRLIEENDDDIPF